MGRGPRVLEAGHSQAQALVLVWGAEVRMGVGAAVPGLLPRLNCRTAEPMFTLTVPTGSFYQSQPAQPSVQSFVGDALVGF